MGIFDKALARLAGEIVKATPGTTATIVNADGTKSLDGGTP